MTQFLVFAGYMFYAKGGWKDFKGFANSLEEAIALCNASCVEVRHDPKYSWGHAVENNDLEAKVVYEFNYEEYKRQCNEDNQLAHM